jgi:hypothetical protein
MTQVIIHINENGGVSVTVPTPEFLENNTIQDAKEKDTPDHSIIVERNSLPQGDDAEFFDAWELNGTTVTVNFIKAQADRLARYNSAALIVAQARQFNTAIGVPNAIDDATWLAKLTADRASIASATTTTQLLAVQLPTVGA